MPVRGAGGIVGNNARSNTASETAHDKRGAKRKSRRRRRNVNRAMLAIKKEDMVKKAGY